MKRYSPLYRFIRLPTRGCSMVDSRYGVAKATYVKPFVKRQKNDMADAEAICEAATQPTMRFVKPKSAEAQATGAVFRARDPTRPSPSRKGISEIFHNPGRIGNMQMHRFRARLRNYDNCGGDAPC